MGSVWMDDLRMPCFPPLWGQVRTDVLIIGGGDGGVARELIHYPQIESIDVVESDKMFVDVCAEMFPDIAQGLKDERVNIYYEDGLRFLRNKRPDMT